MLLTSQEWEKLSPESRHKLNVLVQKVEDFVRSVYGENEILVNMALVEMGVLPNTACSGLVESSAPQRESTLKKLSARRVLSQPATNR